ncbi:short-chain dehydrogenase reductase [Phlyctema vagabunda]|uniref:Short-chain dehydrogenase reductase n=1 Tax=Phlyctema vagabunda TaxID=108571 RepID=A0ABR4P1J7_9HELO
MVSLQDVQTSNAAIASRLPPGLVGVFVGATQGIGCMTMKALARYTVRPRIYFVGRTREAGDAVLAELKALNPDGVYTFIAADVSRICTVDEICFDIQRHETAVNLLFLTTGTPRAYVTTAEDLHLPAALVHYCRARFIVNLLPQLRKATDLRRVVSVFAGGKEGPVTIDDIQGWKVPLLASRGHLSSVLTVSYESIAEQAPDVSFIHNFPGAVKTDFLREATGLLFTFFKAVFWLLAPFICISSEECGERHLFLATSARYPAKQDGQGNSGVPLPEGLTVASGTDRVPGSGVYSLRSDGESSGLAVEELLAKFREDGVTEKVWEDVEREFKRITRD